MAPGGNIGRDAAIFEAVHGSAPDIAGRGIANPSALLLAAAMMLEHVGEIAGAARLRRALELALTEKTMRTPDLGGNSSTGHSALILPAGQVVSTSLAVSP